MRGQRVPSAAWGGRRLRRLVVLAAALLMLPAMFVAGSGTAGAETVSATETLGTTWQDFYAYVAQGEHISMSWSGNAGVAGTVTVRGPGYTKTCDLNKNACNLDNIKGNASGVWLIEYRRPSGFTSGQLWNISVHDSAHKAKPGRVWANHYIIHQWGNPLNETSIDLTLYYVSQFGGKYKGTFRQYNGFYSSFRADGIGVRKSGSCESAYSSKTTGSGYVVGGCESVNTPYKIFFSYPDSSMPETAARWDGQTEWVNPVFKTPAVQALTFDWDGAARKSGTVGYTVANFAGNATLQVDVGADGTVDREIAVTVKQGAGSLPFDGLDAAGKNVSPGKNVKFTLNISQSNEIHFVNDDVEYRAGGIEIRNLRTNSTTLYWDDRTVQSSNPDVHRCKGGTTPKVDGRAGVNSAGGVHGWRNCDFMGSNTWRDAGSPPTVSSGNAPYGTSWGDYALIDDWTFETANASRTVTAGPAKTLTVNAETHRRSALGDQVKITVAGPDGDARQTGTSTGSDLAWTVGTSPIRGGDSYTVTVAAAGTTDLGLYGADASCTGGTLSGAFPTWTLKAANSDTTCTISMGTVPTAPRSGAAVLDRAVWGTRTSWDAPADDGGRAVTGYEVQGSPGLGGQNVTLRQALFENLEPGIYTFKVRARNSIGWSPWSNSFEMGMPYRLRLVTNSSVISLSLALAG